MNKYDIQIGNYVETFDGAIGFVAKVNDADFSVIFTKPGSKFKNGEGYIYMFPMSILSEKENSIKQVGIYRFDKISLIEKFPVKNFNINSIAFKLNELIDRVNAIQETLEKTIQADIQFG